MKKMYSEEQLAEIAGGQLEPSSIPEGVIVDDGIVGINEDNELVKGSLFGKFVRIVDASTINPEALTDEQIELFKEGLFINGELLGQKNPVFFPSQLAEGVIYGGLCVTMNTGYQPIAKLRGYAIDTTNKKLTLNSTRGISLNALGNDATMNFSTFNIGGGAVNIDGFSVRASRVFGMYGKDVPQYPTDQTDKTYVLKLVNGTLTWVEETA